jgi:signal transduction histidine kinase
LPPPWTPRRRVPIPVSVEAGGIGRYPQETEAAIYFCALEALRNAAKHADASRASVRLKNDRLMEGRP